MLPRSYEWPVSTLEALRNSRIFLTGGTGFFGKWLLRFFVETYDRLGVEAVVLSRWPDRFRQKYPQWGRAPNISFVQGDVRSFDFPDGHVDYIIHAAAPIGMERVPYDSPEMYSVIVEGTRRVLDFAEQTGAKRLLQISSGAVYGVQPAEVEYLEETSPCHPVNAYGRGKLESEEMCRARDVSTVIARCFAFIGEYLQLDDRFAVGNFIRDCLNERDIEIRGDGTPVRSYMHGADLVTWLVTLLIRGGDGEIYNVGSDQAISIAECARLVKKVMQARGAVIIRTPVDPAARPARYVPSIRKAGQQLGLSVTIGLAEAIEATAQDWKAKCNAP